VKPQNHERDGGPEKELVRRLELADQIHDLTRSQREAIQSEDWDSLKVILDEKDRRIQAFQEAEQCLKRWKCVGEMAENVLSLQTVVSKTESRLVAVQSMEEECKRMLTDKKNQTARTLQEMKRVRQAIKRFKPHRLRIPRFVDLRR